MRTVHVIVEGPKDLYFLHEFVLQRFAGLFDRARNPIPIKLSNCGNPFSFASISGTIVLKIFRAGGFAKVDAYRSFLSRPSELGGGDEFVSGLVFDADYPLKRNTDGGGYASRGGFILDRLGVIDDIKRVRARKQIFLLPDDRSDGDLETLMEGMVAPTTAHNAFLGQCWKNFETCVVGHGWNRPTGKSRMNEYSAAFNADVWEDNGINRSFTDPSLWDWHAKALDSLKAFLERLLTGTPPESFDGLVDRE